MTEGDEEAQRLGWNTKARLEADGLRLSEETRVNCATFPPEEERMKKQRKPDVIIMAVRRRTGRDSAGLPRVVVVEVK